MPEPVRSGQRYMPGLDGLRAVAVLAVIAYHLQLPFAPGGLLGVGVFFTLSGYLITDLLLGQHAVSGQLRLTEFWLRRARRLLPALFVMLAVVAVWVALLDRAQLPGLRPAMAAAAGYVSNWWLIVQHSSYFARFGPPSPLGHLWSLAVEEQFYLIWPWLLLLGLRAAPGRRGRYWLTAATLALAAASAAGMTLLYHPGYDPTRVYDGTDTRAFALMIGAALAFVWPSRLLRSELGARGRWLLDGAGAAGLIGILLLVWRTGQYSPFLYRGGMVLLSAGTAAVVAASASPASRIGRALGWGPLRWVGVRSYGIYLWHYPIIVLTTPANGGESPARGAAQLAASVAAAALSWQFIEEPVRHGAIGRLWARLRGGGWRAVPREGWAALSLTAAAAAVAAAGLAGVVPAVVPGPPAVSAASASSLLGTSADQTVDTPPSGLSCFGPPAPPSATGSGARLLTSCRSVVHIGDSTSDGLVLPAYQPDRRPADRRPVPAGGRHQVHPRGLRGPVDRGDLARIPQRLHGRPAADRRRLPRLLGDRAGHQRRRRRGGGLQRRPARPDPADDVADRRPAGDVGQRHVAARVRPVRGPQHAAVGPGAAAGLPELPGHARLRLGRRGQAQLVHPGRHPLQPAGVRRASPPDRRRPGARLSPGPARTARDHADARSRRDRRSVQLPAQLPRALTPG